MTKARDIQEFIVCFIDLLAVMVSLYVVAGFDNSDLTMNAFWVFPLVHFITFYTARTFKHFFRRGYFEEAKSLAHYSAVFLVVITLLDFMTREDVHISRRGISMYLVVNFIMMYTLHTLSKLSYSQYSKTDASKKVFLITTMDRIREVRSRFDLEKAWGGSVTAITILDDHYLDSEKIAKYFPFANIINWDNRIHYAIYNVVDEVFINVPSSFDQRLVELIYPFEEMGIDTSVNIRGFDIATPTVKKIRKLGGFQVVTFSHKFYNQIELLLKRLMDIVGACVGLVFTGIISIILIPLIVLESPGNPIYAQNRVGKNGRIFKFYKFRSMYTNADEIKAQLMDQNEMNGLMFKMEDDPRITRVGKFIRRTSIDEFPQFFNVLRGDMSLVGTRPPTEDEYKRYSSHHKRRLSFKPGLTGLWQVSGRNEISDFDEVVKLDVEYINNWSIWLDLKIILMTVKVVLFRKGAR